MKPMMKKVQILMVLSALLGASLLSGGCGKAVEREAVGTRTYGSQEASVEEIRFRSGRFRLVGDLRMPTGEGPHPAIIMVHGDGPVDRNGHAAIFNPAIEVFLRTGYAVFSWDKPGSGESTGSFKRLTTERAAILVDGIEVMAEHPDIDSSRIGLWGISQAGWVMPRALAKTDDAAFMIIVGGGGESGVEQFAYQVGQKVACGGGTAEQAKLVEETWAKAFSATNYDEYREAVEILLSIPQVKTYTDLKLAEKRKWKPLSKDNPSAFYDPMEDIGHTTIPVLVFFGELDKNVDPVQGAEAYEAALLKAGSKEYQVVIIPGVAHTLVPAETGCLNETWGWKLAPEYLKTMEEWLQHLVQ
jgi:pimeloyl-ACP methyl ester carboxylesterase